MATEIRGTTDDSTRMMLGQLRKVFEPRWIQGLGNGDVLVSFKNQPDSEDELIRFAEMYGLELKRTSNDARWYDYTFA